MSKDKKSKDNTNKPKDAFEVEPEYDFSEGERGRFYTPKKITTTIRLDDDIILYFKKKASEEKWAIRPSSTAPCAAISASCPNQRFISTIS